MIPVLSSDQIRKADAHTIANQPISSIDLMEEACKAFCNKFTEVFDTSNNISIVCGPGNNGGDGMGVARLLKDQGYSVTAWYFESDSYSDDFKINLDRFDGTKQKINSELPGIDDELIIDAIFGSGINREVSGAYKKVIDHINLLEALVVAIDIPSGLRADESSSGSIIMAHYTLSFQVPKLSFFMPENDVYIGEWDILDIGLLPESLQMEPITTNWIEEGDLSIPVRPQFSHKGTFGHCLIVGGSKGTMGAVVMASRAALRSGVGLLTAIVPNHGNDIMQATVPEAMTITSNQGEENVLHFDNQKEFSAVGIGPGLGTSDESLNFFTELLGSNQKNLVIDADAINLLSNNRHLLSALPQDTILTPHPGEFKRLVGEWQNDFERLDLLKDFCARFKLNVALKGAYTAICLRNGDIFFNSTGNPGMATGGSGDVLTGIITALLAKSDDPAYSLTAGVYLHGLAGDFASLEYGEESLLATDIVQCLPQAIRYMMES